MIKTFRIKDIKEVDNLSTKRLLSYYKARRKERISFMNHHTCDCCGSSTWELYPKDEASKKAQIEMDIIEKHLEEVKELLSKREHVKK